MSKDNDRYYFVKCDVRLKYDGTLAKLKGAPLAVYLAIGLHVNRNGIAYPSLETLSEKTGYSRRQVVRAIKKLTSMGLIGVERGGFTDDGKPRASVYRLKHFCYGRGTGRGIAEDASELQKAESVLPNMSEMSPVQ